MFKSARIKLTAWYLFIIMLVSISFSVVIYRSLTFELNRIETMERRRIEGLLPPAPPVIRPNEPLRNFRLDPALIEETKTRLAVTLSLINLIILAGSAMAGYFLAGRTLRPIADMVDEQNRFISDASHEIRTPLTSLKSEIEVNLRNGQLTLDEAKKILRSNLEEVNNLDLLSDRLIKLIKYHKKENGLSFTEISLTSLINVAVKKVSPLAKAKEITLNTKMETQTLKGNEAALTEMLVIFLDNAIKYSHRSSKINLVSYEKDNNILVSITDYGLGIDEKNIPHLFDRFYREDKSRTKTQTPGYGLGLSIAKQIIERHQGSVSVESQLGKGTTFTVRLPKQF